MTMEFSRLLRLSNADRRTADIHADASPAERRAAAERLGVEAVETLKVDGKLVRLAPGDLYEASGAASLEATRICIVTLEPFTETTTTDFVERFTTTPEKATPADADLDPDALDIELADGDVIDFGELALQYLAMALDPYPRAPDAPDAPPDAPTAPARRPFADLDRMLKAKRDKD